jgi:hypothetical protein
MIEQREALELIVDGEAPPVLPSPEHVRDDALDHLVQDLNDGNVYKDMLMMLVTLASRPSSLSLFTLSSGLLPLLRHFRLIHS